MNELGFVSSGNLCMCVLDNAKVCTMRPSRNCKPALVNIEYESLSGEEFEAIQELNSISKSVKDMAKKIDKSSTNVQKTMKHMERTIRRK